MKRIAVMLAVMMLVCSGLVFADDCKNHNVKSTGPAHWNESWKDDCDCWKHTHSFYQDYRRNPMGAGIDLVLFEGDGVIEAFTAEARHDFSNEETSVFGVARVNAFKMVKGLFR